LSEHLPPWHPHALHSAVVVVVATAARRAGAEAVVHLSQWLANPAHPSLLTREQWLTEQLLEQTFGASASATHTTINPGFFADNYLGNGLIELAAQLGVLPQPLGSAPKRPTQQRRQCPRCGRRPARSRTARWPPLPAHRPRPAHSIQVADVVGDALGRRVRYLDMPERLFGKALRVLGPRAGITTAPLAGIRRYYQESKLGTWERGAPTSHVRDVTGREPEDLPTIAGRYAARPEASRAAGNLARPPP